MEKVSTSLLLIFNCVDNLISHCVKLLPLRTEDTSGDSMLAQSFRTLASVELAGPARQSTYANIPRKRSTRLAETGAADLGGRETAEVSEPLISPSSHRLPGGKQTPSLGGNLGGLISSGRSEEKARLSWANEEARKFQNHLSHLPSTCVGR